jgi:hypothetical protein
MTSMMEVFAGNPAIRRPAPFVEMDGAIGPEALRHRLATGLP